jgi:hypothetical protein
MAAVEIVRDHVRDDLFLHRVAVDRAGPRLFLRRLEPLLEQLVAGVTGGNAREFLARALLPAACALLTEQGHGDGLLRDSGGAA